MWALMAGAALAATPLAAQHNTHPLLDDLIAKAEAADPDADPAAYHANFVAALEEARKHYPEGSPQIAAREGGVATGLAAMQRLDEASALLERVLPVLEAAQPAERKALLDALSLRGYIAVFKADHALAIDTFERALPLQREEAGDKPDAALARSISNLAAAYREAGRPADALRVNTEAIELALTLDPPPPDAAIWYANRAAYLRELGRDDEAVAVAYEGLAYAERVLPVGHPVIANLYANLAMLQVRQGRPNAAIPLARQAFELVEKAAGAPNQNSATMRAIFAIALVQAGRFEEGAAFLEHAIPLIDSELGAESNRALQAREAQARTLLALGRLDEAVALQQQVVAVRDARLSAGHVGRMEGRMVLATIELARGDAAAAETALAGGVALRAAAMPATHPDLLSERALLLLARSRAGSAAPDALVGEARALLAALKAEAERSASGALTIPLRSGFAHLAEVLARAGDTEGAFEAQQWSARTSVDDAAIAAQIARAEADSGAAADALGRRRQLIVERGALLGAVEAQLSDPKEDFDLTMANARLAELDAAIANQEAALAAAGAALPRFAATGTATLRTRLAAGELFMQVSELRDGYLVTALAPDASWQYLVSRDQADIRALAARLRASLDPAAADRPFDREAASLLYAAIFRPELAATLGKAARLKVSANGALGAVPFAVLAPEARGDGYLLDRLAIARLPGVPRDASGTVEPLAPGLVALGDVRGLPADGASVMRGGRQIGSDALPALPNAAAELADLALALGATDPLILTGDAATEEALRSARIAPGSVLAFATHGLVSGEVEGLREPALLLTAAGEDDGLLTASEIARLDLPARWVLLSACNTAAGAGPDAPGLSGLAQAFIMAGADEILATHWRVRDDMARLIATGTLREAAGGAAPAEALRASVLAARASGRPQASHPALWGAFELIE